jgi:hypothetical protein
MNARNKWLILFSMLALVSCSSSRFAVRSDVDRRADFRRYATYRIQQPRLSPDSDPILNSSLNQRRITEALTTEMNARGYEAVEGNADLVVIYQTDVRDRQDYQNFNNWGYWGWMRSNPQVRNVEETRLIIDLIDTRTRQTVWQGWATGELARVKGDREAAFREIVYEIMREYRYRAGGGAYNVTSRR